MTVWNMGNISLNETFEKYFDLGRDPVAFISDHWPRRICNVEVDRYAIHRRWACYCGESGLSRLLLKKVISHPNFNVVPNSLLANIYNQTCHTFYLFLNTVCRRERNSNSSF
jgi:hypothetical protein